MPSIDRIILGTANFHPYSWDAYGRRTLAVEDADTIVARAAGAGFAGFDTADGYGFGAAEATLGRNARHLTQLGAMAVTTKVGYNFYNQRYDHSRLVGRHFAGLPGEAVVPFDTGREFSHRYLRFAVERAAERLDGRPFNVLLHCPSSDEVKRARESATLAWLARLPFVTGVGLSVKRPEELLHALNGEGLDIVQIPAASLRNRAMCMAVECARNQGVVVMVNQPFDGGQWLTNRGADQTHGRTPKASPNATVRTLLESVVSSGLCDYIVVGVSQYDHLQTLIDACGQDTGNEQGVVSAFKSPATNNAAAPRCDA